MLVVDDFNNRKCKAEDIPVGQCFKSAGGYNIRTSEEGNNTFTAVDLVSGHVFEVSKHCLVLPIESEVIIKGSGK